MSPLGSNHAATRPKVASTQQEESEGVFASIPRQILLESMHKVDGNRYSVVIEAIKTKCVIKCTRQSVTQRLELSFRQALQFVSQHHDSSVTAENISGASARHLLKLIAG